MSLSSANSVTCVTTWDTHPQCHLRWTGSCPRQEALVKITPSRAVSTVPLIFCLFHLFYWSELIYNIIWVSGTASLFWEFPAPRVPVPEISLKLLAKMMTPACLCPKVTSRFLPDVSPRWWSSTRIPRRPSSNRSHTRPQEPGKRPKYSSLCVILMSLVAILEALGSQWNTSYQRGDWSQSPTFKRTFYAS